MARVKRGQKGWREDRKRRREKDRERKALGPRSEPASEPFADDPSPEAHTPSYRRDAAARARPEPTIPSLPRYRRTREPAGRDGFEWYILPGVAAIAGLMFTAIGASVKYSGSSGEEQMYTRSVNFSEAALNGDAASAKKVASSVQDEYVRYEVRVPDSIENLLSGETTRTEMLAASQDMAYLGQKSTKNALVGEGIAGVSLPIMLAGIAIGAKRYIARRLAR